MEISGVDRENFRNLLGEIANTFMPFGRFGPKSFPPHGVPIYDLPEDYLLWFAERGFPKGKLGGLMAVVAEIKEVGMDGLFDPIRQARGGRVSVGRRKNR